jgi:NAD(P)-dependent dehydrogenase (short-subunit alcohol dehydrogenase family)
MADPSIAVVTGASRGIGRVVAERLAASGQRVVAVGRSASDLEELAADRDVVPLVLDVTDGAAVQSAWARIIDEVGVPRLVVNNAGLAGPGGPSWEHVPADWWRVFEVNVLGVFLISQAAVPAMLERGEGRIVNVSSNAAFFPVPAEYDARINSAYMSSKAALIRFSEALAGEAAAGGVRVFAISPGLVKTEMTTEVFADVWSRDEMWSPPELTAELVEFIDSGALDGLSGRYIHAANDDWRALAGQAAEVMERDTHSLRVR